MSAPAAVPAAAGLIAMALEASTGERNLLAALVERLGGAIAVDRAELEADLALTVTTTTDDGRLFLEVHPAEQDAPSRYQAARDAHPIHLRRDDALGQLEVTCGAPTCEATAYRVPVTTEPPRWLVARVDLAGVDSPDALEAWVDTTSRDHWTQVAHLADREA